MVASKVSSDGRYLKWVCCACQRTTRTVLSGVDTDATDRTPSTGANGHTESK